MSMRTAEDVFVDYCGRRRGILRALTTDVEKFYQDCSPNRDNLCLYGHGDGTWAVSLPCEEVPPELPEPALGVNFARDGMKKNDWLSLVAVHSDSWLMAVAFYNGARLDEEGRRQLFNDINSLPTCFEIVSGRAATKPVGLPAAQVSKRPPGVMVAPPPLAPPPPPPQPQPPSLPQQPQSQQPHAQPYHHHPPPQVHMQPHPHSHPPPPPAPYGAAAAAQQLQHQHQQLQQQLQHHHQQHQHPGGGGVMAYGATVGRGGPDAEKMDEDGNEEKGGNEEGGSSEACPNCGRKYKNGEFWICCDTCDRWFDGKCVGMTAAKAERQPHWKCPLCIQAGL